MDVKSFGDCEKNSKWWIHHSYRKIKSNSYMQIIAVWYNVKSEMQWIRLWYTLQLEKCLGFTKNSSIKVLICFLDVHKQFWCTIVYFLGVAISSLI